MKSKSTETKAINLFETRDPKPWCSVSVFVLTQVDFEFFHLIAAAQVTILLFWESSLIAVTKFVQKNAQYCFLGRTLKN